MARIKESKVNLYIVDDDEMSLKILRNKFSSCFNYRVYTYKNGHDFLEEFMRFPFTKRNIHIVILDYAVNSISTDGSSIDLMKKIREVNSQIEIIMISGLEDVDVASAAIKAGAVAFIKKNENSYLRVQNQVKYIISQKSLNRSKQHNKLARVVFVASMLVLAAFAILVFFTDYL